LSSSGFLILLLLHGDDKFSVLRDGVDCERFEILSNFEMGGERASGSVEFSNGEFRGE